MARTVIRFTVGNRARAIGLASGVAVLGAAIGASPASAGSKSGDAASDVEVRPAQAPAGEITCLLPADVDRLGSQVTRLGARREVQLTPEECAARGGEVEAQSDGPPAGDESEE
jgi:hypothetical protein